MRRVKQTMRSTNHKKSAHSGRGWLQMSGEWKRITVYRDQVEKINPPRKAK